MLLNCLSAYYSVWSVENNNIIGLKSWILFPCYQVCRKFCLSSSFSKPRAFRPSFFYVCWTWLYWFLSVSISGNIEDSKLLSSDHACTSVCVFLVAPAPYFMDVIRVKVKVNRTQWRPLDWHDASVIKKNRIPVSISVLKFNIHHICLSFGMLYFKSGRNSAIVRDIIENAAKYFQE